MATEKKNVLERRQKFAIESAAKEKNMELLRNELKELQTKHNVSPRLKGSISLTCKKDLRKEYDDIFKEKAFSSKQKDELADEAQAKEKELSLLRKEMGELKGKRRVRLTISE